MNDPLFPTIHHLSLCSGIGGLDLGLRKAVPGLRTLAYVEGEAFCIANLAQAMETGELDSGLIYPDLHRFPWDKYRGVVDLVSGGVPCQPFSQAGKRKGVEDERHLWPVIRTGLEQLGARIVFLENVEGIATAKSPGYESVLHHVLCDLERMDFRATAGRFTAREVGAPHRRRRWFILGVRNPDGESEPDVSVHAEAPGMRGDMADSGRISRKIQVAGEHAAIPQPRGDGADGVTCWPSPPGQPQQENEPPRTIEPGLGRNVDGVSGGVDPSRDRIDRLRALGNAVVPDCAAVAFTELWHELHGTKGGHACAG